MQNPAQSLLLEYLNPKQDDRILALEGGAGWLAQKAARRVSAGEVQTFARDVREAWAAQSLLESIPNASASLDVFSTIKYWDTVLLTIPKGRRYARTLLLAAWEALKPGGQLLLAGPSKGGAKAVIKDAERLFGNAAVLGYRSHQRVAACIRGEQLPDPLPKEFQQPGVAPGTQHFVKIERPTGTLKLETHPGIFSWEALDEGTALLLNKIIIEPEDQIWDVGCGYGVIGLAVALAGASFVAMSDINLIGIDYARRNAVQNGLGHKVEVFPADTLSPPPATLHPSRFDLIISNPAFHQDRNVDKSMADQLIQDAPKYLSQNGRLVLVANRFLNYDKAMRECFSSVERIAETSKFHVIEARV
jgi:16S rRNA (guanine1207-N2)-methyltransferase